MWRKITLRQRKDKSTGMGYDHDKSFCLMGEIMSTDLHRCIVCEQSSQEIPLLVLEFQNQHYWICPQHFPILIHKPEQLIGKLPGVEKLQGHQH